MILYTGVTVKDHGDIEINPSSMSSNLNDETDDMINRVICGWRRYPSDEQSSLNDLLIF